MNRKEQPLLFSDSLDGKAGPGWAVPPRDFRSVPGQGRLCLLDTATRRKRHPLLAVGDSTWSRYRVEFEFMPKSTKGWNAPGREAHFGGRLVPDERAVALRLRKGENRLLVRTKVVDPWGWGFLMRLQHGPERTGN